MSFIITFSGMVGTGKSNSARYVSSELVKNGYQVFHLRFRQIGLKSFIQKKRQISKFWFEEQEASPDDWNGILRGEDFHLKPIGIFLLLVWYFFWKSFLLFWLIKIRYPNDIVIVDRFIYDNLANYNLSNKKHWFVFRTFLRFLPKVDIPFILDAEYDNIKHARFMYTEKFIRLNLNNYRFLKDLDPRVVVIKSDNVKKTIEKAMAIVNSQLSNNCNFKDVNFFHKKAKKITEKS